MGNGREIDHTSAVTLASILENHLFDFHNHALEPSLECLIPKLGYSQFCSFDIPRHYCGILTHTDETHTQFEVTMIGVVILIRPTTRVPQHYMSWNYRTDSTNPIQVGADTRQSPTQLSRR